MANEKLTSIADTVFDMVDNVGLVLERMNVINGIFIDALSPTCSLDSNAAFELHRNAYNLVNNQPFYLLLTHNETLATDKRNNHFHPK